jgi:hypothetical protein
VSEIKEQVIEMLQDIPDDKIVHILEIVKGLKTLYGGDIKSANLSKSPAAAMGIFKKYAKPELIPREKDAWGEAVREKHGNH